MAQANRNEQTLATDPGEAEDQFDETMRAAAPWQTMLDEAEQYFRVYQEKCDNIDKLYADLEKLSGVNAEREMKIFWANVEIIKPSIYASTPEPVVSAKFKDRKPLIRHSSEMLERALKSTFEEEDIHETLLRVRDDLALNGRGVAWVRLEEKEDGYQCIRYDHIDRADFLCEPAREWKETGWVARRAYLSMEDMRERFEETSGDAYMKAEYEHRTGLAEGDKDSFKGEKKAAVWEMWHKTKNVVVWITKNATEVLDIQRPFLDLRGFFPCPKPAFSTLQRRSLKPIPDFLYYKDQIEEINELTARISALSESLRLKGFYAAGHEDVGTAIEAALKDMDNRATLIPVPSFAVAQMKMQEAIAWIPLDMVVSTIQALVALRREIIDDVYQVSGLSDIMRGATNANETLGAQQLKAQYGSVRIKDRQEAMVRLSRDLTRIAAEIMAENFSEESLLLYSQYDELPRRADIQSQVAQMQQQAMQLANSPQGQQVQQQDPEQAQQLLQQFQGELEAVKSQITLEDVIELLRSERIRPFVLEIETDSTIAPDENAAKQRVAEFTTSLSSIMGQLIPMVQTSPHTAQFAGEVLKFAVKPFRAGRDLDDAIDGLVDQINQVASQPQPNPEEEKIKADVEAKQNELALRQEEMQGKQKIEQERLDLDRAEKDARIKIDAAKIMLERAKLGIDRENRDMEKERFAFEKDARTRELDGADKDRKHQRDRDLGEMGIPPDYTFDDDRAAIMAVGEAVASQSEKLDALLAAGAGMQAALQQLVTLYSAPKRVLRDRNGDVVGVEPVLEPETEQ